MRKATIGKMLNLAILGVFSAGAQAVEPASLTSGPLKVYPSITVDAAYDDNIYTTATDEKDSWITIISPKVLLEAQKGANTYSLQYSAKIGSYNDASDDNYDNHQLLAKAEIQANAQVGFNLQAEYLKGSDARGSTDRVASDDPDEWHSTGVGGVFRYGGENAKGRVEIEADHVRKRYDNNRDITSTADLDQTTLGATFYWRVKPKTSLLFQVQNIEFDYQEDPYSSFVKRDFSQDSDETRYLVGVTWDATAKTSGTIKVGRLEKDFDDSARDDYSGTSWDVGVKWSPKTYSTVDFTTGSTTNETTGIGDTIEEQYYGASWNHSWNSRFSTTAHAKFSDLDYHGDTPASGPDRNDELEVYGLAAKYEMRRWLNIGASYTYSENDSDSIIADEDFEQSVFMLSVEASL